MLLATRGACSLPIYMRDEWSHFRIWDRLCSSDIQFVLCGERKVIGAVDPIPLRERTAINVNGLGFRRLIDRIRPEKAAHLPDRCPGISALGFWTVSSHYLPRIPRNDPRPTALNGIARREERPGWP